MNQEQLADSIKSASSETPYEGELTQYAVQSILSGRSNYPVANLLSYCKDMNISFCMMDMATEDCFYPISVLEVHKVMDLLMKRYLVDPKLVYRKTAVHYTPPKSLNEEDLKKIQGESGQKYQVSLSIKTLLAVCEVIHCNLSFAPK